MVVRMSRITLRCKKECDGLLLGVHGMGDHNTGIATSFYRCNDCGKQFKVVSQYSDFYDDMILLSSSEIPDTRMEVSIDERAQARLAEVQEV